MGKVLVVDDQASMRDIACDICEALDHEVMTANDGEEGLTAYEFFAPDLVITDKEMPRGNGLWLTREIKKLDPNAKLILYTGWSGMVNQADYVAIVDKDRLRHLENVVREFFRKY